MKNLCLKTRPRNNPYEIWESTDGRWKCHVLKKWQSDNLKPYARWFCEVFSPFVSEGEIEDVYVSEILEYAKLIKKNL